MKLRGKVHQSRLFPSLNGDFRVLIGASVVKVMFLRHTGLLIIDSFLFLHVDSFVELFSHILAVDDSAIEYRCVQFVTVLFEGDSADSLFDILDRDCAAGLLLHVLLIYYLVLLVCV
jgi:hypothetical protein